MVNTVTWRKDGVEVGSEFTQTQTITDTLSATYQHSLSSEDIANFVGNFTCQVEDTDGNMDQRSLFISGNYPSRACAARNKVDCQWLRSLAEYRYFISYVYKV